MADHSSLPLSVLNPAALPAQEQRSVARAADEFFAAVLTALRRIKSLDGSGVAVSAVETSYVIDGFTYRLQPSEGEAITLWVGLNGPRIYFVATLDMDQRDAESVLEVENTWRKFDGWLFQYSPIDMDESGCALKVRCVLTEPPVDAQGRLTETGLMHAVEVASLAQDLVRDFELYNIGSHPGLAPAPHN